MFTPSEMDYIIDVIYSCDAGYLAVGETVQSCLEIGYWTAPPPRCYSMYDITLLIHCYTSHILLHCPNTSCALQQQKQCRSAWKYDTTCREYHLPIATVCIHNTSNTLTYTSNTLLHCPKPPVHCCCRDCTEMPGRLTF